MVERLRKRGWGCLLMAAAWVLTAGQAWAFDEATADRALRFAKEQLERTSTRSGIALDQYPKNTLDNATWRLVPADNQVDQERVR